MLSVVVRVASGGGDRSRRVLLLHSAAPKNPIAFICLPIAYVSYQVSHQP
ncbi:hypothetical protein [Brasilonema octagenarum]|nr:hypothetical protein [Brasilonema octagenarum]